ncbi:multidrug resistance protein MdtO [Granulicella pectinivorans]|uniref:Multidrug resistance protein MdtO n=1 Tax=Granulicella pectinivorans TaxID=474950 RepID=A0A1I6LN63_9BACT|nr:FUSC family protein [Granulicella pectinivorans]SFS04936.1 multidrug resistance protein MdtO [Granulicella pectinivorans]
MATGAIASVQTAPRLSWTEAMLQDLQPTPGRLAATLRVVLASIIALLLMETLQMPFIAIGMYFIFLIGRDSPAVSLRSSLFSLGIVCFAIVVEFGVVILSDNDPMARLLSVAVVTFIAGMIVVTTSQPALGSSFGLIYCTVISLWEIHAPADRLVKTSLYLVGTFLIALGSAVAVEYIFGDRNPAAKLQEQRRIRYSALATMFELYAENAPQEKRFQAASAVSRIAIAGQAGMMTLYNAIVEQNLDTGNLPIALRPRITMLAQLMDVAAAFGLQNPVEVDADTRVRSARLAEACRQVIPGVPAKLPVGLQLGPTGQSMLLDRVEGALHSILTMPHDVGSKRKRELVALPRKEIPFFIPGAIRNPESVAFGLKISLCATFCYVLYHALAWPGISTAVTTVLVTGLSSTGALKQRLIFRVLGSLIGGLILALGAAVFLFPHMDSLTSLVLLEAAIAFIAAWIAAGPRLNYIGLQIAFAFYLVAYEGFSAPTQLAPARDRFVGIMIALGVMLLVFDQLWPVRTTTVMRRGLAAVLRVGADLFTTLNMGWDDEGKHQELLRHADVLRDRLGATVASLRSANTSVPFEFGAHREEHIQTGDMILRSAITAAALFWNQLSVLHNAQDLDYLRNPELRAMRQRLAAQLIAMADGVASTEPIASKNSEVLLTPAILANPRYAEYATNTLDRFEELQNFVAILERPR